MNKLTLLWILLAGLVALLAFGSWRWRRARRAAERRAAAAAASMLAIESARVAREKAARSAAAEAQARAQAEAAARVQVEAEARARAEAQARARIEAEARARIEAEAQARIEAEAEAERRAAEAARQRQAALQAAADAESERLRAEAARQANAAPPAPEAREVPVAPPPPRALTPAETLVMVADDSKVVRVKTSRLLAQHGYRVVLAEDGEHAARLIDEEVPLVLITDVEMPGMDGFALARHVRTHPRAAHIPIIMITSADERLKDAADAAGVTMVLGKPYPEDALIACIQRAQSLALN